MAHADIARHVVFPKVRSTSLGVRTVDTTLRFDEPLFRSRHSVYFAVLERPNSDGLSDDSPFETAHVFKFEEPRPFRPRFGGLL